MHVRKLSALAGLVSVILLVLPNRLSSEMSAALPEVVLTSAKSKYRMGEAVEVSLDFNNRTLETIAYYRTCAPAAEPPWPDTIVDFMIRDLQGRRVERPPGTGSFLKRMKPSVYDFMILPSGSHYGDSFFINRPPWAFPLAAGIYKIKATVEFIGRAWLEQQQADHAYRISPEWVTDGKVLTNEIEIEIVAAGP